MGIKKPNNIEKEEAITTLGVVVESFPNHSFAVEVKEGDNVRRILAYLSGKIRKFKIKVMVGDVVDVEFTPYDLERGRITYRHKNKGPTF